MEYLEESESDLPVDPVSTADGSDSHGGLSEFAKTRLRAGIVLVAIALVFALFFALFASQPPSHAKSTSKTTFKVLLVRRYRQPARFVRT